MTMKQVIRTLQRHAKAAQREHERAQRRAERATIAQYKASVTAQQHMHAASTVHGYQNYVRTLVSYHRSFVEFIDWHYQAQLPPPPAPVRQGYMERAATDALRSYRPNFAVRLLQRDGQRLAELEQHVINARLEDDRLFSEAQQNHAIAHREWQEWQALATRVASRDPSIYPEILESFQILNTFAALGTQVRITEINANLISLEALGNFNDTIPPEEFKLTSTGKLSSKALAKANYWSLVRDHICSCALRLAVDCLSVLPIERVIINLGETRVSTVTGHPEPMILLGVDIARATLQRINLAAVDPADAMANFNVRWSFHKTKGFTPVEPLSTNENWISTR